MKFIGGRDYYDNALAFGRDETITFVRHRENPWIAPKVGCPLLLPSLELKFEHEKLFNYTSDYNMRWKKRGGRNIQLHWFPKQENPFYFLPLQVWFCGECYNAIEVHMDVWGKSEPPASVFWNYEDFNTWLHTIGVECIPVKKYKRWGRRYTNLVEYFGKRATQTEKDFLIDNQFTIVIGGLNDTNLDEWQVDTDQLKTIGFVRKIDPYTAFQEISMWVGGVLPKPGRPMLIPDPKDHVKNDNRFDNWSFRKQGKNSV